MSIGAGHNRPVASTHGHASLRAKRECCTHQVYAVEHALEQFWTLYCCSSSPAVSHPFANSIQRKGQVIMQECVKKHAQQA